MSNNYVTIIKLGLFKYLPVIYVDELSYTYNKIHGGWEYKPKSPATFKTKLGAKRFLRQFLV